jgi:hypothetical protein
MQSYEVTFVGKQIAHESGLEGLPEHLLEIDYHSPLLVQLTEEYSHQFETYEEIEDKAIRVGRQQLKTDQERLMFERGLNIDDEEDSWKRTGELAQDTLFPNHSIDQFMPATDEDRFILSGIVGLQLVDFRQRCHLLARSRYQEYGFKNFNESCAFVGAYVVSTLCEDYRERIYGGTPSFTYEDNGLSHKILIGGSLHGDFRMSEARSLTHDIISPINTETEFSPVDGVYVSAYHSIEPSIVESMLVHELLKGDKQSLNRLIDELIDICRPLVDSEGNVKHKIGNFADYGQDGISDHLVPIEILLAGEKLRDEKILCETIINPGNSDDVFAVISLEGGIRFENSCSNYDDEYYSYIDINRQQFGDLFNALLSQTQAGLGRTAPYQLIKLIIDAKKLLDD